MLRRLLFLALVLWFFSGLAQIRPEERAVIKRFGAIVARPGPGLWIGLPWPMDRIERVPISMVRRVTAGAFADGSSFLTGDQNLIELRVAIDFLVAEGDDALDAHVLEQKNVEELILRQSEMLLASWAGGQSVDAILLLGNAQLPTWLLPRLQQQLDPLRLGVRIQQVSIAQLGPPDVVRSSFEEVNRAQTQLLTQENRARQDAATRMRSAEGEAYRLQQQAIASRDGKLSAAQAEVAAFLARLQAYRQAKQTNPNVLQVIWLQEIGQILLQMQGRSRVEMLDAYLGPNGLDINQAIQTKKK